MANRGSVEGWQLVRGLLKLYRQPGAGLGGPKGGAKTAHLGCGGVGS